MSRKDLIKGVIPSDISKSCITYKSPSKGRKSVSLTKVLLDKLFNSAKKAKSNALLVLTIPCNKKENYVVTCSIKKERA